ncbi:MAG: response regulator transcription factor [Frankiaceae bacterium]|nr:response regulator transcription factor [Frankiaceae bacterium]
MRAVIAEDDVLLRTGIARLLTEAGFDVVEVGDASALTSAVDADAPDVVVTDIRMPPTYRDEGTRAALTIRAAHPGVGIVILSQHVEARYAEQLLREHPRGIGYLLKERVASPTQFVSAVREVAGGGSVLDADVVSALLSRRTAAAALEALSPRELEVLSRIATGRSNAAIGEQLGLTARTVETHVANVFAKLGLPEERADNRRVLAVLAHLRAQG